MNETDKAKKHVGEEAVLYVKNGMKVGLGSGSTVYWMIRKLGELVQQGLRIEGIPSSNQTAQWAKEFGVPLTDFSKVDKLDITIDGADEVDLNLNLIKGGGGALLREKVIANAAKELIIIADKSKFVTHLGKFPLPIEVLPFGWEVTAKQIGLLGCQPIIRKRDLETFVSDNGNYILDCSFEEINDPQKLHEQLIGIVGVVETGLFVDMANKVIVSNGSEIEVITS
ncbi:ribose 5-phosphate isomerase A [Oceanobacillus chungangensis]|uniref:Ribose-5-phosphate isomerase A n=1 Tax=Oceanobacillus chungangensis TaxID=1229152 RepID=A0A3D8PKK5_9BACI|nr:ribose-5-phosphate isomerase RpiA [Oceanobacillus chungangensis]RDW15725.1 ribose 5-phosphate isomerase A [Oceanobacillus chungangensis]